MNEPPFNKKHHIMNLYVVITIYLDYFHTLAFKCCAGVHMLIYVQIFYVNDTTATFKDKVK